MKRTMLLMMTVALLGVLSVNAFAGDQDFILVNQTGLTVDSFFCSPTTTNNWEEDVLGQDVLLDGESVTIKFSRDEEACNWDLMIVDEDGDKVVWGDIDLCQVVRITLFYKDGKPTARLENEVVEEEEEEE